MSRLPHSVGATGEIFASPQGGGFPDRRFVGSWEMVAADVPAPVNLVLPGLGVAGTGFTRRRRAR